MMETANLRDRDDGAIAGGHDGTRNRRVFVQRQVRAGPFVVRTITGHQPLQSRLAKHDDVIETLATRGSDEALDECIFPWCPRGREHFLNAHGFRRDSQAVERVIAIVDQISRCLIPRKGLAQLLGRPRRRRMGGDRGVPDTASIVARSEMEGRLDAPYISPLVD